MPMLLIALWGETHHRKLTSYEFHGKRRKLLLIEMAGALLVGVSIACSNVQPLHILEPLVVTMAVVNYSRQCIPTVPSAVLPAAAHSCFMTYFPSTKSSRVAHAHPYALMQAADKRSEFN
jgi:hypothetical protein